MTPTEYWATWLGVIPGVMIANGLLQYWVHRLAIRHERRKSDRFFT